MQTTTMLLPACRPCRSLSCSWVSCGLGPAVPGQQPCTPGSLYDLCFKGETLMLRSPYLLEVMEFQSSATEVEQHRGWGVRV